MSASNRDMLAAKPLKWSVEHSSPSGYREYSEGSMGFHITRDPSEERDCRYCAAWGEGDAEHFPTLKEAKAWCQDQADAFIRDNATAPPPSPPEMQEFIRAFVSAVEDDGEPAPGTRWHREYTTARVLLARFEGGAT